MYILTSATLAPDQTVYATSLAGRSTNMFTECVIEQNSSKIRGTLHAVVQGCKKLEGFFGMKPLDVDVLVDADVLETLQSRKSVGKLLHGADDDLWQRLFEYRKLYSLKFFDNPGDSERILPVWKWSCTPPTPATLPVDNE